MKETRKLRLWLQDIRHEEARKGDIIRASSHEGSNKVALGARW
jgi:hypothetical protein